MAVDFAARCQVSTQKEHGTPGPLVIARTLRRAKQGHADAGVMAEPSSPQSIAVSPSEANSPTKSKKYVQLAVLWVTD